MSSALNNPQEYYASPVSRSEQVSFKSKEGVELRDKLDSLDLLSLDGIDFIPGKRALKQIPRESGIYFVIVDEKLVYIGQTCSLARRLRQYHAVLTPLKKSKFFTVRWLLLPRNQRLKAETYLTRRFLRATEKGLSLAELARDYVVKGVEGDRTS